MYYFKFLPAFAFLAAMFMELIGFFRVEWLFFSCRNLSTPKHRLLKQILLRFTNCAKLNIRICNTKAFVNRYLNNYSFCKLHYDTFEKAGVFFCILGLLGTTYATFTYGGEYYQYAVCSLILSIIYVMFCRMLAVSQKKELIVDYISDYLDNTVNHRITQMTGTASQETVMAEQIQQDVSDHEIYQKPKLKKNAKPKKSKPTDTEIIYSVLNDYLS